VTAVDTRPNAREADIDTKLADLWSRANGLRDKIESTRTSLASALNVRGEYVRRRRVIRETWDELVALYDARKDTLPPYEVDRVERTKEARIETEKALAEVRAEAEPLEALYDAKPWSRFFLVTNRNGHIHSSMRCSTCRWDTRFSWLPELSGLTEKDAVDAYGTRLCSVCFPTAPVEWTLGIEKPVDPDTCEGSGTNDNNWAATGYRRYAKCDHCGRVMGVSSHGKTRKHKKEG
jgi:hypothetical protein